MTNTAPGLLAQFFQCKAPGVQVLYTEGDVIWKVAEPVSTAVWSNGYHKMQQKSKSNGKQNQSFFENISLSPLS